MSKLKCKCGSEDFIAKSEDEYYIELVEEGNELKVKVVDEYVLGDVTALHIHCSKCGERYVEEKDYDDVTWEWEDSPLYCLQQQDLPH